MATLWIEELCNCLVRALAWDLGSCRRGAEGAVATQGSWHSCHFFPR